MGDVVMDRHSWRRGQVRTPSSDGFRRWAHLPGYTIPRDPDETFMRLLGRVRRAVPGEWSEDECEFVPDDWLDHVRTGTAPSPRLQCDLIVGQWMDRQWRIECLGCGDVRHASSAEALYGHGWLVYWYSHRCHRNPGRFALFEPGQSMAFDVVSRTAREQS